MRREGAFFIFGGGMEEQLSLLIQLQEIDAKIRTQNEQKNRLPETLAALERRRVALNDNVDKVKEALQTAQKNKRDRDQDLEAGVQKVDKLKTRSSEIKNNKEYQALLKEIETGEQENKAIEDGILGLMEKIDVAAGQITAAEEQAKAEAAEIAAERKQLEASMAKLDGELKIVEEGRQKAVANITKPVLAQYQKLLVTKAGIAIVEARGESCSGCYMSIPPQVFVNVKKNAAIITCPNCNRILYFKESIVPK
jgi:predicted  nucleic acid-binding Zn-ribbon protein